MKGSWCIISIDGQKTKASIVHRTGSKFEIVEDADNGKYVGKIIDASDVINCLVE